MKNERSFAWLLLLILPIAFAGVWQLQKQIDVQRASAFSDDDDLVLRSGNIVKFMSVDYAPLVADFYWTRAVQYFGNKHSRADNSLTQLWPLLDITTTLDPKLLVAYRFGGMFLSDAAPRGAGRPDLAIQLLQRGIQANPEYWRFYEDLGFVYYFDLRDYTKAAEAFREGGDRPGALPWMKGMAARVAAEGNSPETSFFLWKQVYDSTSEPALKSNAMMRMKLLRAQEDCRQIDLLAEQYKVRANAEPKRIEDLVRAGLLHAVPADTDGYAYVFNAQHKTDLNPKSPLFESLEKLQLTNQLPGRLPVPPPDSAPTQQPAPPISR